MTNRRKSRQRFVCLLMLIRALEPLIASIYIYIFKWYRDVFTFESENFKILKTLRQVFECMCSTILIDTLKNKNFLGLQRVFSIRIVERFF